MSRSMHDNAHGERRHHCGAPASRRLALRRLAAESGQPKNTTAPLASRLFNAPTTHPRRRGRLRASRRDAGAPLDRTSNQS